MPPTTPPERSAQGLTDYERLRTSLNSVLKALRGEYPEKLPAYVRDAAEEALATLDTTPQAQPPVKAVVDCAGGLIQSIVVDKPETLVVVHVDRDEGEEPGGQSNRGYFSLAVDPGAVESVFREADGLAGKQRGARERG